MPTPAEPRLPIRALDTPSADAVAHLVSRIGRLLLVYGSDTTHALVRMDEVAHHLGRPVRRLATPEAMIVAAGDDDAIRARIGPAIPAMAVNMGALDAVETVLDALRAQQIDIATAHRRLDAIERDGPAHPAWLVILGVSVTAAALARLFGADWAVVVAAFLAGLVSTILRLGFGWHHINPIAAAFLTALVSGLVAEGAVALISSTSPVLCLTAAGMILVPGVPLINGVRDLVAGHVGIAVARLSLGTTTVLVIGFALFAAAGIAHETLPVGEGPGSLPVLQDLLFSAMAAAGYAMLFNVPWRAVPPCILCGMASHGLRTGLEELGMALAAASLLGAGAAGVIARIAGRVHRVPPVTFAFPGIVAMIPGSYGFRAGIGGLDLMRLGAAAPASLVADTVSLAVTTIVVTVAIAIGLLLALAIPSERTRSDSHGAL